MKTPGETLIFCLALGLSTLLMAASLSYDMRCAALNDRAVADMRACRELREENERLRVGCSFQQSLEQVERYAREELGMQPVCAEQLVRIDRTVG